MEKQEMNTTTILHHLKHGLNSPRATVIRIEALVAIATCLSFFLLIFGSWRRWCKHWFIQNGVLAAYTLSFSLVTYTMGSMQSSAARNEMFPVWALSLFPVLGCTNSITAYSLDDNKQYMRHMIQQVLCTGYVFLIICTITNNLAAVASMLLFFETQQRIGSRILACMLASEFWNPDKQIADYMESEHEIESQYDPVSMKGYTYLVQWNFGHMKLNATTGYKRKLERREGSVTIEKIWQCNNGLLGPGDASGELKDVCLSFALFQLLKRRFIGFHCAETGQMKTKDFVFKGLLLEREGGYGRAFNIIEVELSFLYDFFYTKYAFNYHLGFGALTWAISTTLCLCFIGVVTVIRRSRIGSSSDAITIVNTNTIDIIITLIVLASLALLELLQAILYWASNWGKVALACDYVRQPSLKRS